MPRMVSRSAFQQTSVKQLVCAGEEYGYTLGTDLRWLLRQRSRLLISTTPVEELLGTQKNTKMSAAQRRFKKPETSYHVALKSDLLGKRHKFRTINADVPLERKMARLDDSAFRAAKQHRSLDFQEVARTSSATTWYSPNA